MNLILSVQNSIQKFHLLIMQYWRSIYKIFSIYLCCFLGAFRIARKLIDAGADPNCESKDPPGRKPIREYSYIVLNIYFH